MSRSRPITLPLESDAEAMIQAFPDDGDVRIRLALGGFIRAGLFRFALDKTVSGEKLVRGPVEITVTRIEAKDVIKSTMKVSIRLPKGELVDHTFDDITIKEIIERIDQVKALLHSYEDDPTAMKIADQKRHEARASAA